MSALGGHFPSLKDTVLIFGMKVEESVNGAEFTEGEVGDTHFHLVLAPLDHEGENFALNDGIIDGGVGFDEIHIFGQETESSFSGGLEILSAFGLPTVQNTGGSVLVTVHNVGASQTPQVEQGVLLTPEAENLTIEPGGLVLRLARNNLVASPLLNIQPLVELRRIQLVDVALREGDCLLEVKHCIISSDTLDHGEVSFQFSGGGTPVGQLDFAPVQLFQIDGAFFRIVGGIENFGNGKHFGNEEVLSGINSATLVHNLPTQVIDEGLGDGDGLFRRFGQVHGIGQGGGFAVENHVVFSPTVVLLGGYIHFHGNFDRHNN